MSVTLRRRPVVVRIALATLLLACAMNPQALAGGLSSGAATVSSLVGLGTGVATALGINVGSAGAFVTFNGALGTPSSGTATNLSGTAAGLTAGDASQLLTKTWASPAPIGTGTPAAGTFTDMTASRAILSAAANTVPFASTGYSVTGSGTSGHTTVSGTLNTSGVTHVNDWSLTTTAAGSGSTFYRLRGGAGGTTELVKIMQNGALAFGTATGGSLSGIGIEIASATATQFYQTSSSSDGTYQQIANTNTGGKVWLIGSSGGGLTTAGNYLVYDNSNGKLALSIVPNTLVVTLPGLKTTGAAAGKSVVCVDTTTGTLYASTSDTACAN